MSGHKLAEALRLAREWFNHEEAGVGPQAFEVIAAADAALAAHEAEQQAVEAVAYGMPNSALTGRNRWMLLREEVPPNDQYGGALWVPLYTHPLKRLSVERIHALDPCPSLMFDQQRIDFARALETALGITDI